MTKNVTGSICICINKAFITLCSTTKKIHILNHVLFMEELHYKQCNGNKRNMHHKASMVTDIASLFSQSWAL